MCRYGLSAEKRILADTNSESIRNRSTIPIERDIDRDVLGDTRWDEPSSRAHKHNRSVSKGSDRTRGASEQAIGLLPVRGSPKRRRDTSQKAKQGLGRTIDSAWARRETKPLGRPSQYGVTGDQPNSLSSSSASRAQPTMSYNARAPRGGQVRPLIPPVSASWSSPRARPCDSRLDAGWVSTSPPQGTARGDTGQNKPCSRGGSSSSPTVPRAGPIEWRHSIGVFERTRPSRAIGRANSRNRVREGESPCPVFTC